MKSLEKPSGRTHDAEIDVLRGPCALETKLECHATFERRGVTEHDSDPCQEPIEDRELSRARDRNADRRRRLEDIDVMPPG